jgi:hypothetical protein
VLSEEGLELNQFGAIRHDRGMRQLIDSFALAAALVTAAAILPTPNGVGVSVTHTNSVVSPLPHPAILHFPR